MERYSSSTEVIFGAENTVKAIQRFQSNAEKTWCVYVDKEIPALLAGEKLRKGYLEGKARGIKIRYLTEITKDNLEYCKKIKEVAELRNVEGITGSFAVTESECVIAYKKNIGSALFDGLVYSNLKEMVGQQQNIFDTFWNNAIPAEQKIREIEEGIAPSQTEVGHGLGQTMPYLRKFWNTAKGSVDVAGDSHYSIAVIEYAPFREILTDAFARNIRIRVITEITKDNIKHSKQLMQYCQLYHSDGIKSNIAITDSEYVGWSNVQDLHNIAFVTSNDLEIIDQQKYVFETLLSKAMPAELKIREIEENIPVERTEVISDPRATESIYKSIVNEAERDIMLILPTENAFAREKSTGIIDALKEASARGAKVRILVYTKQDANKQDANKQDISELESHGVMVNKLSLKPPQKAEGEGEERGTRVTAVIADNKTSLVIECKNDEKDAFAESIGTAVLSTGKALASSYATIFESLWREVRLTAQLIESERMQRIFINIAAHELRTPIQPILFLAAMLRDSVDDKGGAYATKEVLAMLNRNAERLQKLSNAILDVTRIEAGSLELQLETLDINEEIRNVVADMEDTAQNHNIQIQFIPSSSSTTTTDAKTGSTEPLTVSIDKLRMFEVISNLLGNAIKYSDQSGTITIATSKKGNDVVVSIKDTGVGIRSEMLPRLFTKFSTDKERGGTGLGLYLAKNFVEAHGGRIWAENSADGDGATFHFSLPLI